MPEVYDIICLSHLRWDFVYQRPQHLLSRFARQHRVFYVEEPVFDEVSPRLELSPRHDGVVVALPHLPPDTDGAQSETFQAKLITSLVADQKLKPIILWLYTPMALPLAAELEPIATVFDCMDELSAFAGASPLMLQRERETLEKADIVFTGGQSLYEAKRNKHHNVHALPSSVDVPHFAQALSIQEEPGDQSPIGHPRIGFFGVVDERMDLDLLAGIASLRPDWHIIILGPVVKIDPETLPRPANIHYLGGKSYTDLPKYIASWDVAILPFALNEATRFISPTKTPEYMAAGRPVVSTPITDVIHPYGDLGLVKIASNPEEFMQAIEESLAEDATVRANRNTAFLENISWDKTWDKMSSLIDQAINQHPTV